MTPFALESISFATLKRTTSTRWCIVEPTANGIIVPAWISRLRDSALANISKPSKWFGGKRGVHVHRELPPYTSVYLSYRDERCVKIRIGSDNKEAYEQLAKDYFDKNHVLKKSAYARIGSFLKQARQISDTFRCYKDAIDFIIDIREKRKE